MPITSMTPNSVWRTTTTCPLPATCSVESAAVRTAGCWWSSIVGHCLAGPASGSRCRALMTPVGAEASLQIRSRRTARSNSSSSGARRQPVPAIESHAPHGTAGRVSITAVTDPADRSDLEAKAAAELAERETAYGLLQRGQQMLKTRHYAQAAVLLQRADR